MKFIDFHTHQAQNDKKTLEVVVKDFSQNQLIEDKTDCIGIHPWSLPLKHYETLLSEFDGYLEKNPPWLLGEMGLDRAIELDISEQRSLFIDQIQLAKKHNIQSVVIHCVRAYSDILKLLIDNKFSGNVILHDFNSTKETAAHFCAHFSTYFSFGRRVFDRKSKASKSLTEISKTRILFETDDTNFEIQKIYAEAARILEVEFFL